jgi:hypothetical protein
MTSLLPSGIQPRKNFADNGVTLDRCNSQSASASIHSTYGGISNLTAGSPTSPMRSSFIVAQQSSIKSPMKNSVRSLGGLGGGEDGQGSRGPEVEGRDLLKVLARLSKSPDSTEFVYLRPYLPDAFAAVSERLTPLNPYHIEVVPHSQVDANNYFTMSSFGVTQFVDGKPTFTELARWQQEHQIFMQILTLTVFRKYRVWKSLLVWKNVVHFGKMAKHQRVLVKNLFWSDTIARSAILSVRALCMDLCQMPLHSFTPGYLYRLDEFCDLQAQQRTKVVQAIESFWEADLTCADKACRLALEQLEAKLFGGGSTAQAEGAQPAGGGGNIPSKLAAALPKDDAQNYRYTVKASKRVEHQRLYHLLRMCDYVIFSTLHQMVNSTLRTLLLHLAPAGDLVVATGTHETKIETESVKELVHDSAGGEAGGGGDGVEGGGGGEGGSGREGGDVKEGEGGGAQGDCDGVAVNVADNVSGAVAGGASPTAKNAVVAVFETEVILEGDYFIFVPSPRDFEEQMDYLVDKYLESVNSNVRLLVLILNRQRPVILAVYRWLTIALTHENLTLLIAYITKTYYMLHVTGQRTPHRVHSAV